MLNIHGWRRKPRVTILLQDRAMGISRFLLYSFIYSILFTGVLRKWVFPDFSQVIMALPQLLAVVIVLFLQLKARFNLLEKLYVGIGLMVFMTSLLFGHGNIVVALYGCLPYWFGLTACAILGNVIRSGDIVPISRLFVITSIVNSVVIMIQYNAPVLSVINVANDVINDNILNQEIANLAGGFRPSGIFMHNSQSTLFYAVSYTILLYNLFIKRYLPFWLCIVAVLLELTVIPFSISRTNMMYHVGISVFFYFTNANARMLKRTIMISPFVVLGVVTLLSTSYGKQAMKTMNERFDNASETLYEGHTTSEGTLLDIYDRNIKYNIDALIDPRTFDGEEVPFWGYGQGMSTQVGGKILGVDENAGFSLAEWDGLRIMCESGYLFGWLIILIRMTYCLRFLFHIKEMRNSNRRFALSMLPVFLLAFNLSTTWGNMQMANMAYLIAGLFLATYKFEDDFIADT